jgi:RNA polymerase sigma factor for flagellar operon FliA
MGRIPTEQEIADEMELELEQLQQLMGEIKGLELGSLNAERSRDDDDEELQYVPAPEEEDPFFLCLKAESRQRTIDAIEELPEKERLVLTLYYYEELTMREIGMTLGVVESRVSQIHSGAIRRLRSALGAKSIRRRTGDGCPQTDRRQQQTARSAAAA